MTGRNDASVYPLRTAHATDLIRPRETTDEDLLSVAWEARSGKPGSQQTRTVNMDGHACPAHYPCAFNNLHALAVGDLIQIKTSMGVLTYQVTKRPFKLSKTPRYVGDQQSEAYNREIAAQVRGQLDLFTCGYRGSSSDSPYNWVVIAHLVAARHR